MYIRELIPQNFAELAEAVPIDKSSVLSVCQAAIAQSGVRFKPR